MQKFNCLWLLLVEEKPILMSLWTTLTPLAVANFLISWLLNVMRSPLLQVLVSRRLLIQNPPCRLEVANSHSTLKRHFVTILKSAFTLPFKPFYPLILSFERREEADIKSRQLGVVFENLRVVGLDVSASHQPTLGSLLNPLNIFTKIRSLRHPLLKDIISGFSGVVRPGEMLRECQIRT